MGRWMINTQAEYSPHSHSSTNELSSNSSEMTIRAIMAGCVAGAVLAAANVYTGLTTGYIDGGGITASILAFALFRGLRLPYSPRENNLTQTIAASAAVMSCASGVVGAIPALALSGRHYPPWALVAWSFFVAVIGIGIGALVRRQLVVDENLPFPTGTATAEVISAMAADHQGALRRARVLVVAGASAALIAWLRDSSHAWLPAALSLSGGWSALQGLELSLSPMLVCTGMLVGPRTGVSVFLSSATAWLLIAPAILPRGANHDAAIQWLTWPGAALVLSSSLTSLATGWRSLLRSLRGLADLRLHADLVVSSGRPQRLLFALALACFAGLLALAAEVFGLPVETTLLALILSLVLAIVCGRSAGETDIAPVGDMGALTQLLFGAAGPVASLLTGSIVAGDASQTAQTLWSFKAGQRLAADPRKLIVGQLIGALVGALVVVPTYVLISNVYGLGTQRLPAPGALSWKATADAVKGGIASMPESAPEAALLAFTLGCVLTLSRKGRLAHWLPSPVALGMGFLLPLPISAAIFLGALMVGALAKLAPAWSEEHVASIAGGAIAGESLVAVLVAALMALGVLPS
jgi:uncharacterized oligopeptide transporter (OPT) family protein